MTTAPCNKCHTDISADATRCPSCGWEPRTEDKWGRRMLWIVAWVLTISIVGIIFGAPLMALASWRDKKAKERTAEGYEP